MSSSSPLLNRMSYFYSQYNHLLTDLSDPRVSTWPLMSSPWPILLTSTLYLLIVRKLGPSFMQHRPPYNIKIVMMVYNLLQTVFNGWMFFTGAQFWLTGLYNWRCQPVDYSNSKEGLAAAAWTWWYFIAKILDLCDSLFFILRNKFSHLSTLHVIHHGIMPISAWFVTKYVPGGHSTFSGFCNMFIHVVMYFYYFLASMGPSVQPYLWWKRYLTQLQICQFVVVFLHALQLLFNSCSYPIIFTGVLLSHALLLLGLFAQFYIEAYRSKKKGKKIN